MHLKVTVCVMTVSPVVNSEREAVKSVVLSSSSLFSESEMVGVSGITVMDVLSSSSLLISSCHSQCHIIKTVPSIKK